MTPPVRSLVAGLAVMALVGPALAEDEGTVRTTDVHRPDGSRASYIVTDTRTGVSHVYDSRTSQRLGWFRSPSEVYGPDGRRIHGGVRALILPGGKAGKR